MTEKASGHTTVVSKKYGVEIARITAISAMN